MSIGQAVKAMVLNGLGFATNHLDDDVLGRALDTIWEYGLSALYPQLAMRTVGTLGLLCRFEHMDSTGFHVGSFAVGGSPILK